MAADALLSAGRTVLVAEAKPSLARKFLMAGKSGLNLTKDEPPAAFLAHFGEAAASLRPMLQQFGPAQAQSWARDLGQELFVGSTGRVFPKVMKASPLLRAWLAQLTSLGLESQTRWRWTGWHGAEAQFDTPDGIETIAAKTTILACGGCSWARLGADGRWAQTLGAQGIDVRPFAPANFGLRLDWSDHMRPHFGAPRKGVRLSAGQHWSRGEIVLSERGLEGGGLYPLGPALRAGAVLRLDLRPDLDEAQLASRLHRPMGKQSLSNHLRRTLKMTKPALALLREVAGPLPTEPVALARLIKRLPVPHDGPRPMDEAISTAGGLPFDALTPGLMLTSRPGTFAAGEMLDWEAPTGGYLLTACLATGRWAGRHADAYCG